jgi:hypothetical protein
MSLRGGGRTAPGSNRQKYRFETDEGLRRRSLQRTLTAPHLPLRIRARYGGCMTCRRSRTGSMASPSTWEPRRHAGRFLRRSKLQRTSGGWDGRFLGVVVRRLQRRQRHVHRAATARGHVYNYRREPAWEYAPTGLRPADGNPVADNVRHRNRGPCAQRRAERSCWGLSPHYSTYARTGQPLGHVADRAPKGRNETGGGGAATTSTASKARC